MAENNKLGYLIDDRFLLHETGSRHPESPKRLIAIQQALDSYENLSTWARVEARPAHREELELVHHPGHIDRIEHASRKAPIYIDMDTAVSSESYRVGLIAAGGVLECVEAIGAGNIRRGFAFVRPPGHHAEPDKAMGFCLFNNVALAAAYARRKFGMKRVSIVDIDLHHGNGTQAAYYHDPAVLYISSHQFPYYPGTGDFHEIGREEGKGYTVNFPLPVGTGDEVFVPIYTKIVSPLLEQYRPELILVSAGFDAYFQDPIGGLRVTSDGYAAASAALVRSADAVCGGKICFVLEGGYSMEGLQKCTTGVLTMMESPEGNSFAGSEGPLFHEISKESKKFLGDLWKW